MKKAKGVNKIHVEVSGDLEEVILPKEAFNFNSVGFHCDIIHEEEKMCILRVACGWCPAYANDPHTIFEIFSPLSKKIELQGHIVT